MTSYAVGYENEALSIEFNVPTDMFVKKIFDKWTEKILPSDSYLMNYSSTTDKLKKFKIDLNIFQQSEKFDDTTLDHKVMYKIKLTDVFPINVPKIELSDDADGILRVTIDFSYDDIKWDHIVLKEEKIAQEQRIEQNRSEVANSLSSQFGIFNPFN
jgi:type VI protein secretion system component Hcp